MAGYPIDRTSLDNRMGQLVAAVRLSLANCVAFKALLDDATILSDGTLQAAPLNYVSAETTLIRASFADMKKLSDIANSAATQPAANDFWFNAKHLTGIQI